MGRKLAAIGIVSTAAYFALLAFVFWGRAGDILRMEPNEVGDFLAGAFVPLAILWLILGFFQQGVELRLNTEALKLQAEELRNSVEQQRRYAEAAKVQTDTALDSLAYQQNRDRTSAWPRLQLQSSYAEGAGQYRLLRMVFFNSGLDAHRVEVTCSPIGLAIDPHTSSFSWWRSGETQRVTARLEGLGMGDDFSGAIFLSYYDNLDQQVRQKVTVRSWSDDREPIVSISAPEAVVSASV